MASELNEARVTNEGTNTTRDLKFIDALVSRVNR